VCVCVCNSRYITEKELCNKYKVYKTTRNSQLSVKPIKFDGLALEIKYGDQYIWEIDTCGYHNPF
jgi:hypothetical protein